MVTVIPKKRFCQLLEPMTLFPEFGGPRHFGTDQTFQIIHSRPSSLGGWTHVISDLANTYRWIPDSRLSIWEI